MNKNKGKVNIHAVLGLVLLAIVIAIAVRMIIWNNRDTEVEIVEDSTEFEKENLDYLYFEDNADTDGDGIPTILFMGNNALVSSESDLTIPDYVEEKTGYNVLSLIAESSTLAERPVDGYEHDDWHSFSCVGLVESIIADDFSGQEAYIGEGHYVYADKQKEYIKTLKNLDLNDVDILVIMYSLQDFYCSVPMPEFASTDYPERTFVGALKYVVPALKEAYPNLRIMLSSPYMSYITLEDGSIELSSQTILGGFTGSEEVMDENNLSVDLTYPSFIDNYFWDIDETNITDYVDGFKLNDAGITLVGDHIIDFVSQQKN